MIVIIKMMQRWSLYCSSKAVAIRLLIIERHHHHCCHQNDDEDDLCIVQVSHTHTHTHTLHHRLLIIKMMVKMILYCSSMAAGTNSHAHILSPYFAQAITLFFTLCLRLNRVLLLFSFDNISNGTNMQPLLFLFLCQHLSSWTSLSCFAQSIAFFFAFT